MPQKYVSNVKIDEGKYHNSVKIKWESCLCLIIKLFPHYFSNDRSTYYSLFSLSKEPWVDVELFGKVSYKKVQGFLLDFNLFVY